MSRRDQIEFAALTFLCGLSAVATAGSVYIRNTTDENGNPRPKISLHDAMPSIWGDKSVSSFSNRFGFGSNSQGESKRE